MKALDRQNCRPPHLAREWTSRLLPGTNDPNRKTGRGTRAGATMGYPVFAESEGGRRAGKGMLLVSSDEEIHVLVFATHHPNDDAFEASASSKNILISRATSNSILADAHGRVVSLGERDMFVQSPPPKVIEDAPSPIVTHTLRNAW